MKEIKKIRIGNDIRLAVDLRQYIGNDALAEREVYDPESQDFEDIDRNEFVNKKYEVYYPNQYTDEDRQHIKFRASGEPISIRNVKAFIINTSRQERYMEQAKKKTKFINRFPIEPCLDCFNANPYDICNSGYATWRAYPRHHWFHPYTGFGVYPAWDAIYKPLPARNDTEYRAAVMATKDQNVVEVSFPARAQLYTGKYKLVVVAEVYAPGFNPMNLKTITVDMPDVFELVSTTQEGIDTGISINVDTVTDILPGGDSQPEVSYDDIYVNQGAYGDNSIALNRTDGSTVNVDISEITAWYDRD